MRSNSTDTIDTNVGAAVQMCRRTLSLSSISFASSPPLAKNSLQGRSAQVEIYRELQEYVDQLETMSTSREFLDIALAREVADAPGQLLCEAYRSASTLQRSLIELATTYLTAPTDADPNLDSLIRFEDAARVLNAVASAVGLPDLRVDVS